MGFYTDDEGDPNFARIIGTILVAILAFTSAVLAGCPRYNVWEQGLAGQAALRRAEQDRQIAVQEAQAKKDASRLLAEAEVERARGVAEANKIIGEGLRGHEEYLRYLWIMSLEHTASSVNGSTVVYVPTEANLPVLEAQRIGKTVGAVDPQAAK